MIIKAEDKFNVILEKECLSAAVNISEKQGLDIDLSGTQGPAGPKGDKGDKGDKGEEGQSSEKPKNPVFSYTLGKLTRIDYDAGAFKNFTYDISGLLTNIEFFFDGVTRLKTFNYTSGVLTSIDEVIV